MTRKIETFEIISSLCQVLPELFDIRRSDILKRRYLLFSDVKVCAWGENIILVGDWVILKYEHNRGLTPRNYRKAARSQPGMSYEAEPGKEWFPANE